MKIIHQNGFTEQELEEFRPIIYKNVLDSAHALVGVMRNLNIQCKNPANVVRRFPMSFKYFFSPLPYP